MFFSSLLSCIGFWFSFFSSVMNVCIHFYNISTVMVWNNCFSLYLLSFVELQASCGRRLPSIKTAWDGVQWALPWWTTTTAATATATARRCPCTLFRTAGDVQSVQRQRAVPWPWSPSTWPRQSVPLSLWSWANAGCNRAQRSAQHAPSDDAVRPWGSSGRYVAGAPRHELSELPQSAGWSWGPTPGTRLPWDEPLRGNDVIRTAHESWWPVGRSNGPTAASLWSSRTWSTYASFSTVQLPAPTGCAEPHSTGVQPGLHASPHGEQDIT